MNRQDIESEIEDEIQSKGLTAPRVTTEDVQAAIAEEWCFTAWQGAQLAHYAPGGTYDENGGPDPAHDGPLARLTICVLVLKNGFTVTGESACASPENFDAEIGRKIARQKAVEKIWPLLGFRLRDKLTARAQFGVSKKGLPSLEEEMAKADKAGNA